MDNVINSNTVNEKQSADMNTPEDINSDYPNKHDCDNCPLKKQYNLINKECK